MRIDQARGGGARLVAPELLREQLRGDDLAGVEEQEREQGALPIARELNRSAVAPDFERAKNRKLHRSLPSGERSTQAGSLPGIRVAAKPLRCTLAQIRRSRELVEGCTNLIAGGVVLRKGMDFLRDVRSSEACHCSPTQDESEGSGGAGLELARRPSRSVS